MDTTSLQKRDWTLLAIALAKGNPLTPVQLQKSLFLFGERLLSEAPSEGFYNFRAYNYGPFSSEVYRDAEALAEDGLVEIDRGTVNNYSQYIATSEGISKGNNLFQRLPNDMSEYAQEIVDWVRGQTFAGLISAIYDSYPKYKVNSVFVD